MNNLVSTIRGLMEALLLKLSRAVTELGAENVFTALPFTAIFRDWQDEVALNF